MWLYMFMHDELNIWQHTVMIKREIIKKIIVFIKRHTKRHLRAYAISTAPDQPPHRQSDQIHRKVRLINETLFERIADSATLKSDCAGACRSGVTLSAHLRM